MIVSDLVLVNTRPLTIVEIRCFLAVESEKYILNEYTKFLL